MWYNNVLDNRSKKELKRMKKPVFLTDSASVKERSLKLIEKKALMAERKKHRQVRRLRSDETKIEVCKTYLALGGNATLTANVVGIPYETIKDWKTRDWWKTLISEIRKMEKVELSAKTKNIVDKTMALLADRLENGDFMYDQKKGCLIRKPINANELNKIATNMLDQKAVLDKATEEQVQTSTNEEKLAKLAVRFAELAQKAMEAEKKAVEVTDVIFVKEENA